MVWSLCRFPLRCAEFCARQQSDDLQAFRTVTLEFFRTSQALLTSFFASF